MDSQSQLQFQSWWLRGIPARFQIDIMMLNFLKYILHQDKNSLMSRFFWAQSLHPTRGDWVSNVKKILIKIDFDISFEEIIVMKIITFKKTVQSKVRKAALKYLLSKRKSKGKEIVYGSTLECQGYLLPSNILTLQDQIGLFSYRTRMNDLKYNFSGNQPVSSIICPYFTSKGNTYIYISKSGLNIM